MSALITISAQEAPTLLWDVMSSGLVPMLCSSPGIGKSSIAKAIAQEHNLEVIDLRLSQSDPTDMNGFPKIFECGTKAGYVPMDTFPITSTPLPEGKDGWLLLLDEMNSAPLSVQAAAYKVVLDKEVGLHSLHEKVFIMAAGNLSTDQAIVNRMSTAMQSRMVHFELELETKAWLNWAYLADIDFRITSFIKFKNEILHKFDPNHNDRTFPCPRTWHFLSDIIKQWPVIGKEKLAILCGTVGEGAGREFLMFSEIFQQLPTIEAILKAPELFVVPSEPSIKYAISGLISNHFNKDTAEQLIIAVERLPIEFQMITLQTVIQNKRELLMIPPVRTWATKNAKELID